jgi:hypothetical protein
MPAGTSTLARAAIVAVDSGRERPVERRDLIGVSSDALHEGSLMLIGYAASGHAGAWPTPSSVTKHQRRGSLGRLGLTIPGETC